MVMLALPDSTMMGGLLAQPGGLGFPLQVLLGGGGGGGEGGDGGGGGKGLGGGGGGEGRGCRPMRKN